FNTVEEVAGQALDWFWRPWWYETAHLDQAIVDVVIEPAEGGERVVVTVEDQGGVPMPVELVVTTADGVTQEAGIPVDGWLRGPRRRRATLTVRGRVAVVGIDLDLTFRDADRSDNEWRRGN